MRLVFINERFIIFKIVFVIIGIISITSCSNSIRFSSNSTNSTSSSTIKSGEELPIGTKFYGKASYYADKFDGRTTANGEIFSQYKKTAAHRTLKFGTILKVTNLSNGLSVVVQINDRGPFVGDRIIDLSRAAAEAIKMINVGVADVECEVID